MNRTVSITLVVLVGIFILAYFGLVNQAESPTTVDPVAENDVIATNTVESDMADPRVSDFTPKPDLITVSSLNPGDIVDSPLEIRGAARGYWFFEADFPVVLTDWDGLIIAEGIATATEPWMTEDFVPFSATLSFTSPYGPGDPDFMAHGSLILQKSNPSGLPENDDALELPVLFAPAE